MIPTGLLVTLAVAAPDVGGDDAGGAEPTVALPAGIDAAVWSDAAAATGVALVQEGAEVRVTATPDVWVVEVVGGGITSRVPPPRDGTEREALLVLAASLADPLGPARAGNRLGEKVGGDVTAPPPGLASAPAAAGTPAPASAPAAAETPAPASAPAAAGPPAPASAPAGAVPAALPRRAPLPTLGAGVAVRLDGGAAALVRAGLLVPLGGTLRAEARLAWTSSSPVPIDDASLQTGALTLGAEVGGTWLARGAVGASLAAFAQAGEPRDLVVWPVAEVGVGRRFPLAALDVVPEVGARADLATTTLAVEGDPVSVLSPLWGTVTISVRPRGP